MKVLRELGVMEVPVSVVDLPPDREKALNVVLNNREAQSDFDVTKLKDLLEELQGTSKLDLRDTGFSDRHVELLSADLTPAAEFTSEPTAKTDIVEVVLCIPQARFDAVRPPLDRLVAEFGLESHVRMR